MKKLQNRKGFTLVELLIVLAIIGILVLVAVPRFAQTTEASKVKTMQSNVRTIASAAGLYMADKDGALPANVDALVTAKYLNDNLNGKPKTATYEIKDGEVTGTVDLNKEITLADFPGLDSTSTTTKPVFKVKFA